MPFKYFSIFSLIFVVALLFNTSLGLTKTEYKSTIQLAQVNIDKLNSKTIHQALQRYYLEEGEYPDKLSLLVPKYIDEVPKVQQTHRELIYLKTRQSYQLTIE